MKEFAKKFYKSKAWVKTREYIFIKKFGLCEKCGKPGEEVHHKIFLTPQNINDPEIALSENNLMLLCKACHFEEHRATNPLEKSFKKQNRLTNNGVYFDEEGNLQRIKAVVVYGAPGSGKTTFVKANKKTGDLVVDLDYLLSGLSGGDKFYNLFPLALGIREYLYRQIEEGAVDSKNIWIIATLPKKQEREQLAKRLKAELIFINTDYETCINQAMSDDQRKDKELQREIINKWFEHYEA